MKAKIFRSNCTMGYDIYLFDEYLESTLVCKPLSLDYVEIKPNEALNIRPTLTLKKDVSEKLFKSLADELTLLGYMQKSDDSGELKAAKYHLEDMRKLVFK